MAIDNITAMLMHFFWGNKEKKYSFEKIQNKVLPDVINDAISQKLIRIEIEDGIAWCYITTKGTKYLNK